MAKRCERPHCETPGRRARWWVWSDAYPHAPRHALCDGCLEPFVERLSETNAPTLGKLQLAPIDPHDVGRPQVRLGG